jgi:starch-binding outer membrane protein, SusD/RagB family
MMKKNRSIYIIALAAMFAFSCNKLVDIPDHPINQIPESRVFSDSADIISAVAGVYSNFKSGQQGGTLGSSLITAYTGLASDELLSTSATALLFTNNTIPSNEGNVSNLWNSGYTNIYQMNACITGIGGTKAISDSLRTSLVAEVKVLRAFYYFQMVNLFGEVPLVTSTDYNVNGTMPRTSVDKVYDLIKADLAEGRAVLKATYPSLAGTKWRVNLYTAMALSAKVYLYRQQWDSAALMVNEILKSGLYSLEATPNSVFQANSKESIWAMPSSQSANFNYQTAEGYMLLPFNQFSMPQYYLDTILQRSFEANDLRPASWIRSVTYSGRNYLLPQKYKNNVFAATLPKEDYVMFRLADMYLVLAEASAQLGQTSDAETNLNIVRKRAGLPDFSGAPEDLLPAIYHERQIEMCYEWGNRWFDLKRTNTIDAVLGAIKPTTWTKDAALFPIPLAQIQANPFLRQNDGY